MQSPTCHEQVPPGPRGCTAPPPPPCSLQGSRLPSSWQGRWERFVIPFSKELCFPWRPSPRGHAGSGGHERMCAWGAGGGGPSVLFMPERSRERCQHQLPAPHDDASLAPGPVFCFCQIPGGSLTLLPLPSSWDSLCVIYLLILLSGSRWPERSWPECTSHRSPATAP